MNNAEKTKLRTQFKNIRNNINQVDKAKKDGIIRSRFNSLFSDKFNAYFIYKSFSSEVSSEGIINDLIGKQKIILIPKCNIKSETMSAVEICGSDSFNLNTYGIPETTTAEFYEGKIDVIVMPGLVFDKKGNRIGYGKGYYDKFINSLDYKPILVGLAYGEQIIDYLSCEDEHDAKLDYVITDMKVYEFKLE